MTTRTSSAQADSTSGVSRVLTWMPYVLLGGLLLVMVRGVSAPVSNADTFFHLRYGHEFLGGWSLRHPGHVSAFGQRDWVPTQWASQMLMAAAESVFGLPGVVWLTGVVVLVTVLSVFVAVLGIALDNRSRLRELRPSLVGQRRPAPRRERRVLAGIALGAVVLLAAVVPVTADRPAATPSWLDPALDRLPTGTAVQTADFMGGYLLWRHPDLDPVIDGYSDAYTTDHLQEQLDLQTLRHGWDTRFRESGVGFALLPTRSRLAYALTTFEDWRALHTSKAVTMLEAPEGWGR